MSHNLLNTIQFIKVANKALILLKVVWLHTIIFFFFFLESDCIFSKSAYFDVTKTNVAGFSFYREEHQWFQSQYCFQQFIHPFLSNIPQKFQVKVDFPISSTFSIFVKLL